MVGLPSRRIPTVPLGIPVARRSSGLSVQLHHGIIACRGVAKNQKYRNHWHWSLMQTWSELIRQDRPLLVAFPGVPLKVSVAFELAPGSPSW